MNRLPLIALLVAVPAVADIATVPTIELTVSVQVLKPDKVCDKAIAVLAKAKNIEGPTAFVSLDGKPSTAKCLEAIFSELSSTANGFKVHVVSSSSGELTLDRKWAK